MKEEEYESFSYTATISCCACNEKINVSKIKRILPSGSIGKSRWLYANYERHVKNLHMNVKNTRKDKDCGNTQPKISSFLQTQCNTLAKTSSRASLSKSSSSNNEEIVNLCDNIDETANYQQHQHEEHSEEQDHNLNQTELIEEQDILIEARIETQSNKSDDNEDIGSDNSDVIPIKRQKTKNMLSDVSGEE